MAGETANPMLSPWRAVDAHHLVRGRVVGVLGVGARLPVGVTLVRSVVREGHERTAGVARVDRGVGLNHVGDGESVRGGERPVDARDDARGDGAVETHRVAEGGHRAARRGRRRGNGQGGRARRQVGDAHRGEVSVGVAARHLARTPPSVAEPKFNLVHVAHDVVVGDDVTVGTAALAVVTVVDESGPRAHARRLPSDVDGDDRRNGVAVQSFVVEWNLHGGVTMGSLTSGKG